MLLPFLSGCVRNPNPVESSSLSLSGSSLTVDDRTLQAVGPDDNPGRARGDARGSGFLNSVRGKALEMDDCPGRLLGVDNSPGEDLEVDDGKAKAIGVDDRSGRALGVDDRTD